MAYNATINDEGACTTPSLTKVEVIGNTIRVTFTDGTIKEDTLPLVDYSGDISGKADLEHYHVLADITDFDGSVYATAAQGAKADSAIQAGANISAFVNDAGYLINTDIASFSSHLIDYVNPHRVTATQVGLGSVNNTADTAKPVSTLQQTAITGAINTAKSYTNLVGATKVDKVTGSRLITILEGDKLAKFDEEHYRVPVATLVVLTALLEVNLFDKERRYVAAEGKDYFYDALATSGDAAPNDQTVGIGFWKTSVATGTSSYEWILRTGGVFRKTVITGTIIDFKASGLLSVTYTAEGIITYSTTATQNSTDANLRDRTTHTGTQSISTITNLQQTLDTLIIPVANQTAYDNLASAGTNVAGALYLIPC